MEYGRIAGISKPLSRICQGTVMLRTDKLDWSFAILDACYEAGITTYDSAWVYGGGESDRTFGRWVAERGNRDKVVLLDKGCHHNQDRKRVTPCDITTDLMDDLARLKFDFVDLFVLHRDDPSVPVGPIVEAINRHIEEGRIKAWGGSNWTHARIDEANRYAAEHGLRGMALSSPHYSLAESLADPWGGSSLSITGRDGAAARQWYRERRMPIFAWSSLCGGFFSGRFARDTIAGMTDPADVRCVKSYCSEDNFRRLDRATELARERGATPAQIALAWLVRGPIDCYPLMAAWTPEQARENAAAASIALSPAEVAWLNLEGERR
jgi:aryl-alcohol dehydrogenase-like predicted oxidoreductase